MKPSLAILLPVYNVQHHLETAVVEILEVAAELSDRLELLILDDGSNDQTMETACRLAVRFPQIDVVRRGVRRGLGPIIQLGLRKTTGQVLIVHDGTRKIVATNIRRLWVRSLAIADQPDMLSASRPTGSQRDNCGMLLPGGARTTDSSTAVGGFHWFERRTLQSRCRPGPGLPQPWHVPRTVRQRCLSSQGMPPHVRQVVPDSPGITSKCPIGGSLIQPFLP